MNSPAWSQDWDRRAARETDMRSQIFALSLAAAALAAGTAGAATWTVDHAHSRLGFQGTVEGAGLEGTFRSWDAEISFDPKALATSHVSVSVDIASAVSGDKDRDDTMPADD